MNLKRMLTVLGMILISQQAYSMIVYDPAVWGQALHTATNTFLQLQKLEQELKLMQQQMLTLKGGQYQWSNAQSLINQLGSIVQQNNALAYSAQNINAQFQQTYPGYQPPQDYGQQYQQITKTTLTSLNNVLQSMGSNANDFQHENTRLAFLQQQEQSADNQLKAIQAATQIASEQVSQIQLLRQVMMAQTNAQTAYFAGQVQQEASARAELSTVITNGATTAPAIGHSGHTIQLPTYSAH